MSEKCHVSSISEPWLVILIRSYNRQLNLKGLGGDNICGSGVNYAGTILAYNRLLASLNKGL